MTNEQPQPSSSTGQDDERPVKDEDRLEAETEEVRGEQAELNAKYDALKQEPGADNRE